MYSECSVRRVCLMDLLLVPIPPASVGQQTLILSKMAALGPANEITVNLTGWNCIADDPNFWP